MINGYNSIAKYYDSLFIDNQSDVENKEITCMLGNIRGSLLDIGCGTGLLVELINIPPADYIGIDPSELMLRKFIEKHPKYETRLHCTSFEIYGQTADNLIALFGAASYLNPDCMKRLENTTVFLMFYKPGYMPATYEKTGVYVPFYPYNRDWLANRFTGCSVLEFNNYLIVTNHDIVQQ